MAVIFEAYTNENLVFEAFSDTGKASFINTSNRCRVDISVFEAGIYQVINNYAGGNPQDIIDLQADVLALQNAVYLNEYVSGVLNLIANTPLTEVTTLTNISDVSVYDSLGNDITDAIVVSKTNTTITLESNNTITNITLRAIGTI